MAGTTGAATSTPISTTSWPWTNNTFRRTSEWYDGGQASVVPELAVSAEVSSSSRGGEYQSGHCRGSGGRELEKTARGIDPTNDVLEEPAEEEDGEDYDQPLRQ
jgi:hypothetical protein